MSWTSDYCSILHYTGQTVCPFSPHAVVVGKIGSNWVHRLLLLLLLLFIMHSSDPYKATSPLDIELVITWKWYPVIVLRDVQKTTESLGIFLCLAPDLIDTFRNQMRHTENTCHQTDHCRAGTVITCCSVTMSSTEQSSNKSFCV